VRADGLAPWTADPEQERFLWAFTREAGAPAPAVLGVHAQQIEIRFVTLYARGAIDLVGYRAHGWKTAPRISHVRLEYEGERLVLQERTTAR
jgi:hypothetical protein